MPSVAEYCKATAGSVLISLVAISDRTSVGNVAGSGNPPENVITSEAPASASIAVISPPPSERVRLARPDVQSRRAVVCLVSSTLTELLVVLMSLWSTAAVIERFHLLTADLTNVRILPRWVYSSNISAPSITHITRSDDRLAGIWHLSQHLWQG